MLNHVTPLSKSLEDAFSTWLRTGAVSTGLLKEEDGPGVRVPPGLEMEIRLALPAIRPVPGVFREYPVRAHCLHTAEELESIPDPTRWVAEECRTWRSQLSGVLQRIGPITATRDVTRFRPLIHICFSAPVVVVPGRA